MFHHPTIDRLRLEHNDKLYALFRIMIGFLFMFHGMQKLFGTFTENAPMTMFSKMWFAGLVEFIGGLCIALGLFTSLMASLSAIVMIVAYFTAHFSLANPWPILNRGELALVYLACFLFIICEGGGKYALDAAIARRQK